MDLGHVPRKTLVILVFGGFITGILFWGGFNWGIEMTNTESFCISCHEMNDNVYQEYRNTIHYHNGSGVRATCPDCHVPREWIHKIVRKVQATNELFHKITGSIDTREKFLAKRMELARHVWTAMEETDSRECRNCHDSDSMREKDQSRMAGTVHRLAVKWGKTCINCHQGISHQLPEGFDREDDIDNLHDAIKKESIQCNECHENMPQQPVGDAW